jgi:hypothetical protein
LIGIAEEPNVDVGCASQKMIVVEGGTKFSLKKQIGCT